MLGCWFERLLVLVEGELSTSFVDLKNGFGWTVAVGTLISAVLKGFPKPLGQGVVEQSPGSNSPDGVGVEFDTDLEYWLLRVSRVLAIYVPEVPCLSSVEREVM